MTISTKTETSSEDFLENLDPTRNIIIKNARVNNLDNLSVAIPRNRFIVVTGLSGSGKSSFAFDTLYAEGQRMYVESLSAYARQFLGRMEKPDVDYIRGISPAIAIDQQSQTKNPRSTVGTTTEIYDYLKLLFSRVGRTYSPVSGQEVKKDTTEDVLEYLYALDEGTKFMMLCPLKGKEDRTVEEELRLLLQKGYSRVVVNGERWQIEELVEAPDQIPADKEAIYILIDRAAVHHDDEDNYYRITDSIDTAFSEGEGECLVLLRGEDTPRRFSDRFELDGIAFEEPTPNLFSFNNPYGACEHCGGFGSILGIDEDLVIPDKSLSVYEGAIAPWRSPKMGRWLTPLIQNGVKFDFPIHRPYEELTEEQKQLLWDGNEYFEGINDFFRYVESKTHKIQYRVFLSRYRGRTTCPECRGTRLRKDASYVKVNDTSIVDLVLKPIDRCREFFRELHLNKHDHKVGERLLTEITNRLDYMLEVGLGYLTLNRLSSSLSGGESQRIKLATSLGSALVGSMYILDEPTIGLHPRDTQQLVGVLERMRDIGNTVIVVEHEEEVIRAADQIIDIGPDAGNHGGKLVFQGTVEELEKNTESHTARFLNHTETVPMPDVYRSWTESITIQGARENNLKKINPEIPLGVLTVISGVSGSGKSTLVKQILYPALRKMYAGYNEFTGKYDRIEGQTHRIQQVEYVDQNPIGKTSRSNPVTYVKAYDPVRELFAGQPLAQSRGYKPAYFSFNVDGGRCETCQGEGEVKIEMQFMADIHLTCESCGGKRFKQEVLEVTYNEKNIADVLDMTVDESMDFFHDQPKIKEKLQPLQEVGLGYIRLGQSSTTLSGGEAQRVKLAHFLGKGAHKERVMFIFDEPTTGLHFHDIRQLLHAINQLVEQGHTAVIIEHNVEVIKCADWVIDLGPEGGEGGGELLFSGRPDELAQKEDSYTGQFLKKKFE